MTTKEYMDKRQEKGNNIFIAKQGDYIAGLSIQVHGEEAVKLYKLGPDFRQRLNAYIKQGLEKGLI